MLRIAVPAATVLLVVVSLVGLAGWNRSAQRQPSMTLTERELGLAGSVDEEGRRLQLRLRVEQPDDPIDARSWLPEASLRAIGFPLHVPIGDPRAADAYTDLLPRVAWVALEYDGPAHEVLARRQALQKPEARRWRWPASRLLPVDVGLDFEALRDRHGPGHLIVRGLVRVHYVGPRDGGPLIYGVVSELVPSAVTVPRHLVDVVRGLEPPLIPPGETGLPPFEPRYEVELGIGRLGIPFITRITRR